MTGPEHYREAERLLQERADCRNREPSCVFCARALDMASVHATLALAAAVVAEFAQDPQ